MDDKLFIGIDASYTRTGISFIWDGVAIKYGSFSRGDFTRPQYRAELKRFISLELNKIYNELQFQPKLYIAIERNNTSMRGAIMASSELIASLEDYFLDIGYEAFEQVSASSWQSFIGRKASDNKKFDGERKPKKMAAINYVESIVGVDCSEKDSKGEKKTDAEGRIWYNDDMADAICLGLYFWNKGGK